MIRSRPALLAAIVAAAVAAVALASVARASAPAARQDRQVTFSEDVAPILFDNCTACHRPGQTAPFVLMNYADVRPRGRQILNVVTARQMPPWKAEHGDFAFAGDRRLKEEDIATIERWVAAGMPQGDPVKQPALPAFTEGWQLGQPDLVVRMPVAFPVPASGPDVYRNFVLPLNLDRDVWVKAVEFRPSARRVTHHTLFFLDSSGAARALDGRDDLPGYAGGMGGALRPGAGRGAGRGLGALGAGRGSAAGISLGGWAPGAQPSLLPDDLAFFVPKASDLILSTHFHPSGQPDAEASTVGLFFAKEPPSKAFTAIQLPPLFGALAGIDIPASAAKFTIADSFVIPVRVRAFGVTGHAHYLAREMTMTATLPGGEVKTLLGIRDWDFNWQEQYRFAGYVDLPAGTRLDVIISYDNSAANRRNPSSPPRRVTWGEESTDEMGSMSLQVVAAAGDDLPMLQQAVAAHLRERAQEAVASALRRGARGGR